MSGWRRSLARWLSPELARQADEAWWLRNQISESKWWLGNDFPIIEVAMDRLTIGLHNHFRSIDEPAVRQEYPRLGGIWHWEISVFREKLKQVFPAPAPDAEREG